MGQNPAGPRARFTVRYLLPTGLPLRDWMTLSVTVMSANSQKAYPCNPKTEIIWK